MATTGESWVQQLFAGIDKLTDVLNVGRLLFYTAAGALVAIPCDAALAILTCKSHVGQPIAELLDALPKIDAGVVILSTVVGFLLASFGFATVIETIGPRVTETAERVPINTRSYTFRYPQLKNVDKEDYSAWLISEYFRFVEIVVFIPLGFLFGLGATLLYTLVYMVAWSATGHVTELSAVHRDFIVVAALFAICTFYIWPRFWRPRVVIPVAVAYHRAKLSLVEALDKWKISPGSKPP